MSFGYSGGDLIAILQLATKVYTAYKDAPSDYKNIAGEVKSLQGLINKASQHFESSALGDDDRQEGQKALEGCQCVLVDLNSLIERYKSLASRDTSPVFKRVKLGTEDIATLRARLTSNATLLSSFIRSCEFREIQAQLTDILGVHRTSSRVSVNSIASFVENANTGNAYKQFCQNLYNIGVTEDTICQKEKQILDILQSQSMVASSRINNGNVELVAENNSSSSKAKPQFRLTSRLKSFRSRFSIGQSSMDVPPMDVPPTVSEAGLFIPAATEVQDTEYSTDISPMGSPPVGLEAVPLTPLATVETTKEIASHKAVQGGRTEIQSIAENTNPVKAMDTITYPLHLAAQNGHIDIVRQLLERGAPIEVTAQDNMTPLHFAAQSGHSGIVELLVEKGALIEAVNKENNTPLHLAAMNGHSDMVDLLLKKGASIGAMGKHSNTPIHCAAALGHSTTVELLLEKGALIDEANKYNNTPLHLAAINGHSDMVDLLLKKGASIGAIGQHNHTPIHWAAVGGHSATVELLLEKGAPIEEVNKYNDTLLHLAAMHGHFDMVDLLLKKGASIGAMNEHNNTPILCAAAGGHSTTVELLLEKGALIDEVNKYKNTPLHLAAMNGHSGTVELLLEKGALIEEVNKYNYTPLGVAAQKGHSSTVELLLRKGAKFA